MIKEPNNEENWSKNIKRKDQDQIRKRFGQKIGE